MEKRRYSYLIIIVFVLVAIIAFLFLRDVHEKTSISNFEECVKQGYPILEGYPRQCQLSNGSLLTECYNYNTTCSENSDCFLIDKNIGYDCCWDSLCRTANYSKSNWVAVNKEDYLTQQKENCPLIEKCGPRPKCQEQYIQPSATYMKPFCVEKSCMKLDTR